MSFPGVWQIQKKPQYPTRCGVDARIRAGTLCFWHSPRDMRVYNGPTDTTSFVLISLVFLRVWNFDTCRLKAWQAPRCELGLGGSDDSPGGQYSPPVVTPYCWKNQVLCQLGKFFDVCASTLTPPSPRAIFPLLILLLSVCFCVFSNRSQPWVQLYADVCEFFQPGSHQIWSWSLGLAPSLPYSILTIKQLIGYPLMLASKAYLTDSE